ncbi:MAG TPA: stage II sporulation protein M [Acidobacteriota bacterium]|nr:stage II sporulation protein M [Acidobacteriota bacterium]
MDERNTSERPAEIAPPQRPPGLARRLYREEGTAWRTHYRKYFKYAARALGLGFVAGYVFFSLWPAQEKRALDFVVQSLKDIPLQASPLVLALTLFYHNARASVIAAAAGVVPFFFVPILDPLLNGGVLGLLVSIAKHQRLPVPRLVLTQIMPHGVFELTAVLYATSVGLYLSAAMGRKVRAAWLKSRARKDGASPDAVPDLPGTDPERMREGTTGSPARNVVRSFVLVVLPLLLVAAFIESFITPSLR